MHSVSVCASKQMCHCNDAIAVIIDSGIVIFVMLTAETKGISSNQRKDIGCVKSQTYPGAATKYE